MQTFAAYWHPNVEVVQLGRHGIENRETRKLVLGTHTGTHIDAPRHFIPNGLTVDRIPLDQLNGPCELLDLSQIPRKTEVSLDTLLAALDGRSVERLIIRFDGDLYLNTMEYYTDQPWLSEECCQWLVDHGCRLLGLDVAMPDNPVNRRGTLNDSPNHKILLSHNVVILEYLVNLASIEINSPELIVAPLLVKHGDGAPVRCFVRY